MKHLIEGALAPGFNADIYQSQLDECNDARHARGALVVIQRLVYNVTDLINFPDYYDMEVSPNWAGKAVTTPGLANWIRINFGYRVVGRLCQGEPQYNVKPKQADLVYNDEYAPDVKI
ncbi:hypothetical protein M426DRAFT_170004 [Hypoxylon sp. CI-4A]|nr:hypothetical protein M426DRAFT_170004 [Hypoxylon sp. CI-4A]